MSSEQALMSALGYQFRDRKLLRQALTHPSYSKADNQRLEFLGDAVLQLTMSHILYHNHPEQHEGGLTHQRAVLVREATLAMVARKLNLGEYLYMDHGEEVSGGREKDSILADAMEAVLAAVYLDDGYTSALALVARLWPKLDEAEERIRDAKGELQEYLQARHIETPSYSLIKEDGPAHDKVFTVRASIAGEPVSTGTGKSKKAAEQYAAELALDIMKTKAAKKDK
ncbi:MAG: ribonuclease III [Eubacteriales bacterium]|nr:ribonuclease III [Eubacteriales bacterium]MDD3882169.1 ribonuclease III [Eubacteriales bacterium]MDD4513787.1 ribonuclease III [Eubacteriales bacterium]